MEKKRVLVVEDEFITASDISAAVEGMGYIVTGTADTGEDAINAAQEQKPDAVLMDINLKGDMNGISAAEIIRKKSDIPVIFLTGQSDDATVNRALESEPFGYIVKPFEERNLRTSLRMAIYKHSIDRELKENEKLIHTLFDATGDPMFMIDQKTRVLIMNAVFINTHKIASGSDVGLDLDTLVGSGFISKKLADMIRDHFSDRVPFRFEEKFHDMWLDQRINPLLNLNGDVTRCAVHSHDVSQIKNAEQDLKIINEQLEKEKVKLLLYEAIVENMHDNVVVTDSGGYILMVNTSFQSRFGYNPDEVKGKHISSMQSPDDPAYLKVGAFIEDKKNVWNMNIVALNKNKIKLKCSLKSTPITGEKQQVYRVFVLRDIL